MIRVLVVEDSPVTREYISYLLNEDPDLEVVGLARNGLEAIDQTERLKPDVILMDVQMPLMNGYQATQTIMERRPTPIVMMSASSSQDQAVKAFEALKAGALTLVNKPEGLDDPTQPADVHRIVQTLKLMAEVKVVRRWARQVTPSPVTVSEVPQLSLARVVAIGASTGGPQVLAEILSQVPETIPVPILVVQHITPGFTAGLVEWLQQQVTLSVQEAQAGELVRAGRVYVAPEGRHLGLSSLGRVCLTMEPEQHGFRPSVSHLFQSVAESYGRTAVGILLTGMGRDGGVGLDQLRRAGGVTIVQNEESCVVFGMPAEAIRLGAAQFVLTPYQVAKVLRSLVPKPEEY